MPPAFTENASGNVCVMELESKMTGDAEGKWKTAADAPFSLSAIDRFKINAEGNTNHHGQRPIRSRRHGRA
jgi:hypothetical protein